MGKKADELMETKFAFVSRTTSYNQLVSLLSHITTTSVLPVVDSHEHMIFYGTTTAEELIKLLHAKEKMFEKKCVKRLSEIHNSMKGEDVKPSDIIEEFKRTFNVGNESGYEAYGTLKVGGLEVDSLQFSEGYTSLKDLFPLSRDTEKESLFKDLRAGVQEEEENMGKRKKKKKNKGSVEETESMLSHDSSDGNSFASHNSHDTVIDFFKMQEEFSGVEANRKSYLVTQKQFLHFLQTQKQIYFKRMLGDDIIKLKLNVSSLQVSSATPLTKVHQLFVSLSPRIIYAINRGVLVGIITKEALVNFCK